MLHEVIERDSVRADRTPRPVVALRDEYGAGFVEPSHSHRRAQLLYACSGVMMVTTRHGSFMIPPQRALWLPAGEPHEVSARGGLSIRTLYIEPAVCRALPDRCCVIEVSELLRALILETMSFKAEYDEAGREGRLVRLLLDEIREMPLAPYHAPMPTDPRLLRVCRELLANPADNRDLDYWVGVAGMARRTFTRQFRGETGMGLAMWRQQVRLLEALSLLSTGMAITQVAFEVGYDSPSAFTAMFHRAFGAPPSQHLKLN